MACAVVFLVIAAGAAQTKSGQTPKREGSTTSQVLGGAGKATVIVVGSAARVGWEVTKFTAANVAGPAAKTLLIKGAPKAAVLLLKTSGVGAKYFLPIALKLSVL